MAEMNYSIIERESLALVFGTSKFRQYLLGRTFVLQTYHQALVKLFGMKEGVHFLVSSRSKKWKMNLAAYDYTKHYIQGSKNLFYASCRIFRAELGCHFFGGIFFHPGRNRALRLKSLGAKKKAIFEASFCTHPNTNIINEMIASSYFFLQ